MAAGYQHVTTEALALGTDVLQRHGERFPTYDAAEAREVADYETRMLPIAALADELSSRVRTSVRMRPSKAAAQLLSLYASMKAENRHDGSLTDLIAKMAPLVRTYKRRKKAADTPPSGWRARFVALPELPGDGDA
jgi:hypothetical protein